MQKYIGTKIVEAEPQDNQVGNPGYKIIYKGGYVSWSPKETFEEAYKPLCDTKEKTLHNSDVSGAHKNVSDLNTVGDGDAFKLLFKASSKQEGWVKSTKAMDTGNGCVVQVTTQQMNPDGSYVVAEAVTFVPSVHIVNDINNGRRLVKD